MNYGGNESAILAFGKAPYWLDRIPMSAMVAGMLFGLFMFGATNWTNDLPHSSVSFASSAFPTNTGLDHSAFRTPDSAFDSRIAAIPIRDIRVGMRVPAHNRELSHAERLRASSPAPAGKPFTTSKSPSSTFISSAPAACSCTTCAPRKAPMALKPNPLTRLSPNRKKHQREFTRRAS
jgi:hypothetical protein